jgi:serine/threonine protein kinase, bacterial
MIGQLLAGHYRILEVLGSGGFGQTYITEDLHLPGNPKCVLKHLKPASTDSSLLTIARKLFEKEAIVLQQLGNHDRIPRLLAYFEEDREFYLVQEYVPGHPLSAELKNGAKWNDSQVIGLLQEILDILVFIHGQGVIHRDIKPDNIMRRNVDRHLILIDFGAIKQVRNQPIANGQQTMTVAIGTPGYMPIEQASGNPRASSDLYALGMIGIQALTGVNPYDLATDDGTGEFQWEHLTIADPRLIAIIQRMTRYHFKDRYLTATEALQAVQSMISGRVTEPTYVQQPQQHSLDSQATVVAARAAETHFPRSPSSPSVQSSAPVQAPRKSLFPLVAGIASIFAMVASFAWFSGNIFSQREFTTDVKSDLCRIAAPIDLSTTKVRSQPQRDAKIQASLPRGTKVVYLAEQDAFIKIEMADRTTGWVYNNQVTGCNVPVATPTTTPKPSISPSESPKPIPASSPKTSPKPSVTTSPSPSSASTPTPAASESPIPIDVPSPSPLPSSSSIPSSVPVYPIRSHPTPSPSSTISPTPSSATPSPTPSVNQSGTEKPAENNRCLKVPSPPDCLF